MAGSNHLLHPATPRGGYQAVMPTPRERRLPPSRQGVCIKSLMYVFHHHHHHHHHHHDSFIDSTIKQVKCVGACVFQHVFMTSFLCVFVVVLSFPSSHAHQFTYPCLGQVWWLGATAHGVRLASTRPGRVWLLRSTAPGALLGSTKADQVFLLDLIMWHFVFWLANLGLRIKRVLYHGAIYLLYMMAPALDRCGFWG